MCVGKIAAGNYLDIILVTTVDEKANIGDFYHTLQTGAATSKLCGQPDKHSVSLAPGIIQC